MVLVGKTVPRIWSRPLRELTPETSLGFEVVDFSREILGVELRPWQQWLLIHALELLSDGQYRFKRVVVLVARQNGKTLLASVLAAWWLFVDSTRHPDRVPPVKFKILGTAQNLDIAREPWSSVRTWADPEPDTAEEADLAIPALQSSTAKVRDTNGDLTITTRQRAHYEVRAAKNARGKPASRVLMDEIREQHTWEAWNAVSQTTKSFWSGQLWAISNAGDARSEVLRTQRDAGLQAIAEWDQYVGAGIMQAEEFANSHDVSVGLFEWSASDDCAKDDPEAILQANPSIGAPGCGITVESCKTDARTMPDGDYRTEVLCQWVTAQIVPFIDPTLWDDLADVHSQPSGRLVLGVDTGGDRKFTYVAVAGFRDDDRPHVEVIAKRAGMLWVVPLLERIRAAQGISEVAIQGRGCPAIDFIKPLEDAGFTVHLVQGSEMGAATGRFRDRVLDGTLRHLGQPVMRLGLEGGLTRQLNEQQVWSRVDSQTDVAPLCAATYALYALETKEPEESGSAYEDHGLMVV